MNYKRILISEAEKKRILGMHTKAKINPSTRLINEQSTQCTPIYQVDPALNSSDIEKLVRAITIPETGFTTKGSMNQSNVLTPYISTLSKTKNGESIRKVWDEVMGNRGFYFIKNGVKDYQNMFVPRLELIEKKLNMQTIPGFLRGLCLGDWSQYVVGKETNNNNNNQKSDNKVTTDKACKDLSPYKAVTNLGLNWKETQKKWIDSGCMGTQPCSLEEARTKGITNINLRNAICKGTWNPKTGEQKGGTIPGDQSGEQKGGTIPGDIVLVDPTNPANSKMVCFFKKLVELKVISRIPVNYKFPKACSTTQAANVLPDDNNLKTCFTEMIGIVAPYLVNIELTEIKVIIIEILVCIFGSEDKIPPVLINLPINIPGKGDIGIQLPDKGGEDWDQWRGGLFPITEKPEEPPIGTPPRTAG
jgi:hypothetical protein